MKKDETIPDISPSEELPEASIVKVEQYVYEKVKKSDVEIRIPNEPIFFQAFNHRVVTGIFPQFAEWNNNKVWELQIIQVTENDITRAYLRTDPKELSDALNRLALTHKPESDFLPNEILRYLRDYFTDDRINKQTFVTKYQEKLAKMAKIIGL